MAKSFSWLQRREQIATVKSAYKELIGTMKICSL